MLEEPSGFGLVSGTILLLENLYLTEITEVFASYSDSNLKQPKTEYIERYGIKYR